MLTIGSTAPEFSLLDSAGNTVTLAGLLATGPVVLYFYPADFTPVCTAQACMFRDRTPELAQSGIRVVGISPQNADSKRRFSEKHHLTFPVLADRDGSVIKAYGAAFLFGMLTRRVTYLIEPPGIIADRTVADLSVGKHEDFIRRVLARHASSAQAR